MALPQAGPLRVEEDGMMRFGTSGPAAQLAVDALTSVRPLLRHRSIQSKVPDDACSQAYCYWNGSTYRCL
jgi:hypothetical protein